VLDDVTQDGHVLLAVGCDAFLIASAPPLNSLNAISTLRGAQRVLRELVELHAMAELLVKFFVDVKRSQPEFLDRRVGAQNFEIEAVAIERDDVRETFKLGDELPGVSFEPAAEARFLVPRDGDGQPEARNISPAAWHLVRKAESFNVQIDFAIEESGRRFLP